MTNLPTFNETPQRAQGIAGYIFNGLGAAKPERDSFESWIATLAKLAEAHEREARAAQDVAIGIPSR